MSQIFLKAIQSLLMADTDPELGDRFGYTPLDAAQELGDEETIDLIQQAIEKKHNNI